ncbi:diguanylate cyclase [Aeromonas encheleia]|uniref:diguanylate cyclase n=1 Tax=Aeromonas encheleia TaxID=73010 RepID=UPI0009FBD819|nr:diguanylate cyclase [Aeromonas encheleia]
MRVSAMRLRAFMSSRFSRLAARRDLLLLVLLVQSAVTAGYLYLDRYWIETGVVQNLRNVSAMHLRSFERLQEILDHRLGSIGTATLTRPAPQDKQLLLQQEVKHPWLDTVAVLDPDGGILSIASSIPLASMLPPTLLKTGSFLHSPRYRAFHESGADSSLFFVSSDQDSEQGGGGMVMFRKIQSADGQLLGSAIGYLSLQSLSAWLNTDDTRGFNLGENVVLAMFDQRTSKLLYRYANSGAPADGVAGWQASHKPSFQETQHGADVKFYRSTVDGVERLAVLTPLHLGQWQQVVAVSKAAYLFHWWNQVIFSVVALACLSVLQWLLVEFLRQNHQQRELLNLVLNTLDAYVYFKTSERRFVYVNAKTAEMFGLPAEQIIGRLDHEILTPEVADHFWLLDSQVFATGNKQSGKEVATTPSGETRYYESVKVPVQLPDQPLALIGVSTDVTELHNQTIAREAAERELAAHNHYLYLNNQVLEQLGHKVPLSEVLDAMVRIINAYHPGVLGTVFLVADDGTELVNCAAPDLPDEWRSPTGRMPIAEGNGSAVAAVLRGERVIAQDVATDPSWAAVRDKAVESGLRAAWAQPIKNGDGRIIGVFNLYRREPAVPDAHDLALLADYARLAQLAIERSRLAEALQESQALYRLIAENSNDVIWVMQYPSMQYSYTSPSVERLRGLTQEDIAAHPLRHWLPPQAARAWSEAVEDHIRRIGEGDLTARHIEIELEVWHKDGSLVPVEVVANIMLDGESRPTHIVGSSRDITRRKAAEDAIRKMAFYDQLTGLPNRRMLEDRLSLLLALGRREQRKLSLLFIDLDRFKAVNDQHGHGAGDWLLKQVASRMGAVLRESDTASRIGGDEFVILLPDARKMEDAVFVAEKIRKVLDMPFVMDDGVELDISSSIGVVMYPDQADNERDLLHFGDEAMYRAKQGGRNAVAVFGAQTPSAGSPAGPADRPT